MNPKFTEEFAAAGEIRLVGAQVGGMPISPGARSYSPRRSWQPSLELSSGTD
jgi:hypothetical protein